MAGRRVADEPATALDLSFRGLCSNERLEKSEGSGGERVSAISRRGLPVLALALSAGVEVDFLTRLRLSSTCGTLGP